MSDVNNDAFAAFAKQVQENQNQKSSHGNFTPREFEEIKWVGLTPQVFKIIRVVGNPPESLTPGIKAGPFDAKEFYFSEIKDDQGKKLQLKLPLPGDLADKDHIMWKIIRKVMEVTYVDKKRVFKNELTHPEVFNKVAHGGWDPVKDFNKYKFSKGWSGQKVVVMNVIDREDMKWHQENKHTALLSRDIGESVGQNGDMMYFPATGVPSFGFIENLAQITTNYGSWENFDLGIKRTGQKTNPYQIVNATAFVNGNLKDIPDSLKKYVSLVPLTDEEKSWKRYDISKMYAPTSYSKIEKRLGGTIKQVDGIFGTNYFDEIHALAEKEAEEMKAINAANAANAAGSTENVETDNSDLNDSFGVTAAATTEAPITESVAKPVVSTRKVADTPAATIASAEKLTPEKLAVLKGYDYLTDAQKDQIDDVVLDSDNHIINIKYNTTEATVKCPVCGAPGLMSHTHCIACGVKFV